jgi:hypothetical protein
LSFIANSTATLVLGVVADAFSLRVAFTASTLLPLLGLPLVGLLPGRATANRSVVLEVE